MPFAEMSDNDLKSFLYAGKPIFYKNSSIKIMSRKTKEMMKRFCQRNQVFDAVAYLEGFSYRYTNMGGPKSGAQKIKYTFIDTITLHRKLCFFLLNVSKVTFR